MNGTADKMDAEPYRAIPCHLTSPRRHEEKRVKKNFVASWQNDKVTRQC